MLFFAEECIYKGSEKEVDKRTVLDSPKSKEIPGLLEKFMLRFNTEIPGLLESFMLRFNTEIPGLLVKFMLRFVCC